MGGANVSTERPTHTSMYVDEENSGCSTYESPRLMGARLGFCVTVGSKVGEHLLSANLKVRGGILRKHGQAPYDEEMVEAGYRFYEQSE
jgi:hypothetical protein